MKPIINSSIKKEICKLLIIVYNNNEYKPTNKASDNRNIFYNRKDKKLILPFFCIFYYLDKGQTEQLHQLLKFFLIDLPPDLLDKPRTLTLATFLPPRLTQLNTPLMIAEVLETAIPLIAKETEFTNNFPTTLRIGFVVFALVVNLIIHLLKRDTIFDIRDMMIIRAILMNAGAIEIAGLNNSISSRHHE
jgi:hypothetical protein